MNFRCKVVFQFVASRCMNVFDRKWFFDRVVCEMTGASFLIKYLRLPVRSCPLISVIASISMSICVHVCVAAFVLSVVFY